MTNREAERRTLPWVEQLSDAIVVLAEMVAEMDGGDTAHGRMKALLHDGSANLVDNHIELELVAEHSHL